MIKCEFRIHRGSREDRTRVWQLRLHQGICFLEIWPIILKLSKESVVLPFHCFCSVSMLFSCCHISSYIHTALKDLVLTGSPGL